MKNNYVYDAVVTRILDGDTYHMEIDLGFETSIKTRIRLIGIDTAETYRPKSPGERLHGLEATALAKELLVGVPLKIKSVKRGSFRWAARVFYSENGEWVDVAETLNAAGMAKKPAEEYL